MKDFKNINRLLLKRYEDLSNLEIKLISSFYKKNNFDKVLKLTEKNKITPFAASIFIKLGFDINKWKIVFNKFYERNLIIKNFLSKLFKRSTDLNINSLVLTENYAVVLSTKSSIALFCSSDVDLFIPKSYLDETIKLFKSFGLVQINQKKNVNRKSNQFLQFYIKNLVPGDFWINISWKPVTRKYLFQKKYEWRLLELIAKSNFITKSNINYLDDNNLLYFSALHIACGHFYTQDPGLRLYVDIDRLIRTKNIDWDKIKNLEQCDNAGIRVTIVLVICNRVFGTPIPKFFSNRIKNNYFHSLLLNYLIREKNINQNINKFQKLFVEILSNSNFKFLKFGNIIDFIKS